LLQPRVALTFRFVGANALREDLRWLLHRAVYRVGVSRIDFTASKEKHGLSNWALGKIETITHSRLCRGRVSFVAAGALLACLACSDESSDDGIANYYLSGRVLDGSTLEPLADAELSLSVGESVRTARADALGAFSVGPITPGSDYRISAQLEHFDAFAFYGSRLPELDAATGRDRALVGDVVLYRTGQGTPEFTITASSRDQRLAIDTSSAEVRFVPAPVGMDPALKRPATAAASADAGVAPAAPGAGLDDVFLPNHALSDVQDYRARIVDGEAVIPAGALRWGAGYSVEVYGGPAFEPERLRLAAGRASDMSIWLTPSGQGVSTELASGTAQYFSGRIYDGVSLDRLTDYSIRLEYFDQSIPGTVDQSGRYFIGPLLANADYSIIVEAEGYRSFLSHNERIEDAADAELMSLYYDAFLYPAAVSTPALTCHVRSSDSAELPSGFMRFAPRSSSSLLDDDAERPVGVISTDAGRQLWENDEDLQQRSFVLELQNGEVTLPSGQLVYGVTYEVTIYGVTGHAVETGSFVAGVDGDTTWLLDPLVDAALAVTSLSTDALTPTPGGQLEVRFNQPIALDPGISAATLQRALNDAFSINSPNADNDVVSNVLVQVADLTPPIAPGYRGVSLALEGDRLLFSWNGLGLSSTDADDPVVSVDYAGLGSVMLYAAGAEVPVPVSLAALLSAGNQSVQLVAE
jgi:hypothetical protein